MWRWDGRDWTSIGSPGAEFVAIGTDLYALTPTRNAVMRYHRYDNSWTEIGGPASSLVGGGSTLYAVTPTGDALMQYSRFERSWTEIGGPGAQFVGVGGTVFGLTPDRSAVFRYDGTPDRWTRVGGPASSLIGGGSVLYATQPGTGTVWRYPGSGDAWVEAGPAGVGFVAVGQTLYGMTPDRGAVLRYDPVNPETRRLRTLLNDAYTDVAFEGRIRRGFLGKRFDGQTIAEHNAGAVFQPLSILKLLPYAHALMQVDRGVSTMGTSVSWKQPATGTDNDAVCFGPTDHTTIGSAPLRDALPTMMWFSHNRSLEAVMNHYSVLAITRNAQQVGMRETEMYLGCGDGTAGGWWAHNMSTLDDLARLYEGMERPLFVSAATRELWRHNMIEMTPAPGTSYHSPILNSTAGPLSSDYLRAAVEREAGSKLAQVPDFMRHVVIRIKSGGGNPTGDEFGYGDFFELTLPFKGNGAVVPTKFLLGWYLNQLHAPIVGADPPELARFEEAMFRQPIRQALQTW